jgi:DNA-binding PadR family transcriptional regulator
VARSDITITVAAKERSSGMVSCPFTEGGYHAVALLSPKTAQMSGLTHCSRGRRTGRHACSLARRPSAPPPVAAARLPEYACVSLSYFDMEDPDLYSGLIRLHVLHHAARGPIYGLAIIEELARHGYRMSPGTMYPLLRGLHAKGYLRVREVREGKRMRRLYTATPRGKRVLDGAKTKVRELFGELFEED